VTVGKGGRILKEIMYDPPKASTTTRKKKKARKSKDNDEFHHVILDEEPSTSQAVAFVATFHRKCAQQDCARERKREAKYWHRYQQEKQVKAEALKQLLSQLAIDGQLDEAHARVDEPSGRTSVKRHNHMGSQAERKRRQVRRAASATRCFEVEGAPVQPTEEATRELEEQLARFDSSTAAAPEGRRRVVRNEPALDDGFEKVTRRTRGPAKELRAMPTLEGERSNGKKAQKNHVVHKAPKNRKSCAVM